LDVESWIGPCPQGLVLGDLGVDRAGVGPGRLSLELSPQRRQPLVDLGLESFSAIGNRRVDEGVGESARTLRRVVAGGDGDDVAVRDRLGVDLVEQLLGAEVRVELFRDPLRDGDVG
jgi:hypothetical protein